MSSKLERTQYQGIYLRRAEKRHNPKDGKPDACFYYSIKEDGKKKWFKVGWKSEGYNIQIAMDMRAKHMQALRHGEVFNRGNNTPVAPEAEEMTFGAAWKIYAQRWFPNLMRPQDEQKRFENHIAPHFADTPLAQITTLDLETFKQNLLSQGLAPATTKHIIGNIRRVFNKLVEWDIYNGRIPTVGVKMPRIDNARQRHLTPQEAELLLAVLKKRSLNWWRIASISLHSGLRLGEILSLTRSDLDLVNGVIHVRSGKTGTRMAYMNDVLKEIFREMPDGPQTALLFPSRSGKMLEAKDAGKTFARVVKTLGMNPEGVDNRQRVVFHTLRHTFASWLAIKGVPIYTISKLMGHATMEMTQRYAHLSPDVKQTAVEKIAAITKNA
jgi:integrase